MDGPASRQTVSDLQPSYESARLRSQLRASRLTLSFSNTHLRNPLTTYALLNILWIIIIIIITRMCSESANLRQGQNVSQKWSGIRIQISDPGVCRIAPRIHYLVGVSQFAEFRKNRPVTVWEMSINFLKSLIPPWWGKWKSDPEFVGLDQHEKFSFSDWWARS